jgi:4-hydroxythreonine-4-phosphate dehydrogenase
MQLTQSPVIALTLGDPSGIGPELIAKLLANTDAPSLAKLVLVGDQWLWEQGQKIAGVKVSTAQIPHLSAARGQLNPGEVGFLSVSTVNPDQVVTSAVGAAGGRSVLSVLNLCMDAALAGDLDAICFAPLNKHAMKLGGLKFEDELHHFADYLGVTDYFCEFNTLGDIWTARVSSHIPLKDAASWLSVDRVQKATRLIYRSLRDSGVQSPRVAVAGFNPHNGDGGTCGREEIEIIGPAVEGLKAEGLPVQGPFPADTIFLQARDGHLDAIVTMYHDQGQIAIKLLGFSQGVTVHGGLPVPITTPAHGTAYDIAGRGTANVQATYNALRKAVRMGSSVMGRRKVEPASAH